MSPRAEGGPVDGRLLLARDPDCFVPHNHREFVRGCFRCDLSRAEVTRDPLPITSRLFDPGAA